METIYIKADHEWGFRHFDILSEYNFEEQLKGESDTFASNKIYYSKDKNNLTHVKYLETLDNQLKIIKEKMGLIIDISTPKYSVDKKLALATEVLENQMSPENLRYDAYGNYLFTIKIDTDISYLLRSNIENLCNMDLNKDRSKVQNMVEYCKNNEQEYLEVYPFPVSACYKADVKTKQINNKKR